MKKRPLGITILVCIGLLGTVFYCALALTAAANPGRLRSILEGMSGGGTGPAQLLRLGTMLPLYFVVMAVFTGVLCWGLWRLKNWVRLVVIVIIGLSVLGGAMEIVRGLPQSTAVGIVSAVVRLLIAIAILWYLCSKSVRAAFLPRN